MTAQEPEQPRSEAVGEGISPEAPRRTLIEQVGRKLASFNDAEWVFDAPEDEIFARSVRFDYVDKARAVLATVTEDEQDQTPPHNRFMAPRVEAGAKAAYEDSTGHVWGSKPQFMQIWRQHSMVVLLAAEESDARNGYHRVKVDDGLVQHLADGLSFHLTERDEDSGCARRCGYDGDERA